MILIWDVESSGLWRDELPLDDPSQPHLLQLACKLVESDLVAGQSICRGRYSAIIKPDGWSIEPQAEAVHGISERLANRVGVPVKAALIAFRTFGILASRAVAHHVNFDRRVMTNTFRRANSEAAWFGARTEFVCTMERSTDVVGIRGEFGNKFPTLEEAHRHFHPGLNFTSRHDAEEDLAACEDIYWALVGRAA